MVCFCKDAMGKLQLTLPKLDVAADASLALDMAMDMQLLANWLGQFGLPAAPWEPDEAWLDLELPTLSLSASAMATLSAFAQLRVGALGLGIDLLVPGQANAFARLAATLSARLSAMLSTSLSLNAGAWTQLSATLTAVAQVQAALQLGIFPSPPAGPPLALWRPFLIRLRALLPMIAISGQLGLSMSANLAAELGAMLRLMLRVPMPTMLPSLSLSLMASLTAGLSAIAQLKLSLGIDPLAVGLPAVRLMVAERVTATANAIQQSFGLSLPNLLAMLPRIEYCPTLMAPPAVVNAAIALNLPPISWQVPAVADLPVLSLGLPVVAFTTQLSAALDISPSLSPCGAICDAASVLNAALAG
jgi:hypothetical protein